MIIVWILWILGSAWASLAQAEGLGVTCWARPVSLHRVHKHNVCFRVPETQYPGINGLAARPLTIKQCQDANALDPGCEHGACCYPQCEKVTTCLGLTPNKTPDLREHTREDFERGF